jgi:hypothetical protein
MEPRLLKPVRWIGSQGLLLASRRGTLAYGLLFVAQLGEKHRNAKPLKGFGGAGGLEIVANQQGDTFRAITPFDLGCNVCAARVPEKNRNPGSRFQGPI